MVTAKLRFLHSPDADPLETFTPNGPFGILVMAIVGPADGPGQESFDFMLCTPDWFSSTMKHDITIGRHHVFVKRYAYARLQAFVETYCTKCSGASWKDVADKLGASENGNSKTTFPRASGCLIAPAGPAAPRLRSRWSRRPCPATSRQPDDGAGDCRDGRRRLRIRWC